MLLKKGSRGPKVVELQKALKEEGFWDYPHITDYFGSVTEGWVRKYQEAKGLFVDGVAGEETLSSLGLLDTDLSTNGYETSNGLFVDQHFLPQGEYLEGPVNKEYVFLHHTAGWHNPYQCIDIWARDKQGRIGTEFVLGGQSVRGNDDRYDGVMVQAFPEGGYAWHLGKNGSQHMHVHSVGIELCSFGYIKNGKTYAGTVADESQVVKLDKPFRGFQHWHRYSDTQISQLKKWILYIAERDSIDVRDGVVNILKNKGVDEAFAWNEDAYYGRVKGMWMHVNTMQGKVDLFPQPELIDMLLSL